MTVSKHFSGKYCRLNANNDRTSQLRVPGGPVALYRRMLTVPGQMGV